MGLSIEAGVDDLQGRGLEAARIHLARNHICRRLPRTDSADDHTRFRDEREEDQRRMLVSSESIVKLRATMGVAFLFLYLSQPEWWCVTTHKQPEMISIYNVFLCKPRP